MRLIWNFSIAKSILTQKSESEILVYVKANISSYASDYEDGREFISECFSAYYSGVPLEFAEMYVEKCKEYVERSD